MGTETFSYDGKIYEVNAVWRCLYYLIQSSPNKFGCIEEIAKLHPHNLNLLQIVLSKLESTLKLPCSTILQYVASIPAYSNRFLSSSISDQNLPQHYDFSELPPLGNVSHYQNMEATQPHAFMKSSPQLNSPSRTISASKSQNSFSSMFNPPQLQALYNQQAQFYFSRENNIFSWSFGDQNSFSDHAMHDGNVSNQLRQQKTSTPKVSGYEVNPQQVSAQKILIQNSSGLQLAQQCQAIPSPRNVTNEKDLQKQLDEQFSAQKKLPSGASHHKTSEEGAPAHISSQNLHERITSQDKVLVSHSPSSASKEHRVSHSQSLENCSVRRGDIAKTVDSAKQQDLVQKEDVVQHQTHQLHQSVYHTHKSQSQLVDKKQSPTLSKEVTLSTEAAQQQFTQMVQQQIAQLDLNCQKFQNIQCQKEESNQASQQRAQGMYVLERPQHNSFLAHCLFQQQQQQQQQQQMQINQNQLSHQQQQQMSCYQQQQLSQQRLEQNPICNQDKKGRMLQDNHLSHQYQYFSGKQQQYVQESQNMLQQDQPHFVQQQIGLIDQALQHQQQLSQNQNKKLVEHHQQQLAQQKGLAQRQERQLAQQQHEQQRFVQQQQLYHQQETQQQHLQYLNKQQQHQRQHQLIQQQMQLVQQQQLLQQKKIIQPKQQQMNQQEKNQLAQQRKQHQQQRLIQQSQQQHQQQQLTQKQEEQQLQQQQQKIKRHQQQQQEQEQEQLNQHHQQQLAQQQKLIQQNQLVLRHESLCQQQKLIQQQFFHQLQKEQQISQCKQKQMAQQNQHLILGQQQLKENDLMKESLRQAQLQQRVVQHNHMQQIQLQNVDRQQQQLHQIQQKNVDRQQQQLHQIQQQNVDRQQQQLHQIQQQNLDRQQQQLHQIQQQNVDRQQKQLQQHQLQQEKLQQLQQHLQLQQQQQTAQQRQQQWQQKQQPGSQQDQEELQQQNIKQQQQQGFRQHQQQVNHKGQQHHAIQQRHNMIHQHQGSQESQQQSKIIEPNEIKKQKTFHQQFQSMGQEQLRQFSLQLLQEQGNQQESQDPTRLHQNIHQLRQQQEQKQPQEILLEPGQQRVIKASQVLNQNKLLSQSATGNLLHLQHQLMQNVNHDEIKSGLKNNLQKQKLSLQKGFDQESQKNVIFLKKSPQPQQDGRNVIQEMEMFQGESLDFLCDVGEHKHQSKSSQQSVHVEKQGQVSLTEKSIGQKSYQFPTELNLNMDTSEMHFARSLESASQHGNIVQNESHRSASGLRSAVPYITESADSNQTTQLQDSLASSCETRRNEYIRTLPHVPVVSVSQQPETKELNFEDIVHETQCVNREILHDSGENQKEAVDLKMNFSKDLKVSPDCIPRQQNMNVQCFVPHTKTNIVKDGLHSTLQRGPALAVSNSSLSSANGEHFLNWNATLEKDTLTAHPRAYNLNSGIETNSSSSSFSSLEQPEASAKNLVTIGSTRTTANSPKVVSKKSLSSIHSDVEHKERVQNHFKESEGIMRSLDSNSSQGANQVVSTHSLPDSKKQLVTNSHAEGEHLPHSSYVPAKRSQEAKFESLAESRENIAKSQNTLELSSSDLEINPAPNISTKNVLPTNSSFPSNKEFTLREKTLNVSLHNDSVVQRYRSHGLSTSDLNATQLANPPRLSSNALPNNSSFNITLPLKPRNLSASAQQTVELIVQRIRILKSQQGLLSFDNLEDSAYILFRFLKSWVGKLWSSAISASYKRVDCPPKSLEGLIEDDLELMAEIEKLRKLQDAETKKFQKVNNFERVAVCGDSSYDRNDLGGRLRDELKATTASNAMFSSQAENSPINECISKQELMAGRGSGATVSIDVLKDLGLKSSLFEASDIESETKDDKQKDSSSLNCLEDRQRAEAEFRAQEINTVRRKQGKLTREVSVEDIIVVLESEVLISPLSFKTEVLRFFRWAYNVVPVEQSLTHNSIPSLTEGVFISYKSSKTFQYVAKNAAHLKGGKGGKYNPGDNLELLESKRFVNIWPDHVVHKSGKSNQKGKLRFINASGNSAGDEALQNIEDKQCDSRVKRKRSGIARRFSVCLPGSSTFSSENGNPLYLSALTNNSPNLLLVDGASATQHQNLLTSGETQQSIIPPFSSVLNQSLKQQFGLPIKADSPGLNTFSDSNFGCPPIRSNSLAFLQRPQLPFMYFPQNMQSSSFTSPTFRGVPLQYPGYLNNTFLPSTF